MTTKNFLVIYATEENAFEMEKQDFATIEDAQEFLNELADDTDIDIEDNTIEGIDADGYEFYAHLINIDNLAQTEKFFEDLREDYIRDNF